MRKTIITLLILIFTNSIVFAQKSNSIRVSKISIQEDSIANELIKLKSQQGHLTDCEFAIKNAIDDFNKRNFSFHSQEFYPPECTYCDVLEMNYNVMWYFTTDEFSREYYNCYDSIMTIKLKTIYGDNFLQEAMEKADSLEKTPNCRKDAQFPGGETELLKFIYSRLKVSYNYNEPNKTRVIVHLEIDINGKVNNPQILRGINKEIDDNIISIMNEMPAWQPAYRKGKPIGQYFSIPINIEIK
jgi:protein TonB